MHVGSDQGLNPGPLRWEHRVLSTAPPGKSPELYFYLFILNFLKFCLFFWLRRVFVAVHGLSGYGTWA